MATSVTLNVPADAQVFLAGNESKMSGAVYRRRLRKSSRGGAYSSPQHACEGVVTIEYLVLDRSRRVHGNQSAGAVRTIKMNLDSKIAQTFTDHDQRWHLKEVKKLNRTTL